MDKGTIISIVIIVVVLALIGALIAISYAVSRKKAGDAEEAEEAEEAKGAEPAEEPAVEAAEEPAEPVEAAEPVEEAEPAVEAAEEPAAPVEEAEPAVEAEPVAEEAEPAPIAEIAVSASPAEGDVAGEALVVRSMSPALRAALGVVGAEHDEEVYSVRYSYSFLARLVLAAEGVKGYYSELIDELASYKKLRLRSGRRQQNINVGRQRVAAILFKGKKLCLALALDPAQFAGTKYRGKDVSAMKRFSATPMLFKVDSPRKIKYAKYLIARLAENNGLEQGKVVPVKSDEVPALTRDELLEKKEIKATGKRLS